MIPAELAYSNWGIDLVIERVGDVLGKLAKFSPNFMIDGREATV